MVAASVYSDGEKARSERRREGTCWEANNVARSFVSLSCSKEIIITYFEFKFLERVLFGSVKKSLSINYAHNWTEKVKV